MTRPPLLRRLTLRKGREPIRGEGGRLGASDVPLAAPHLFDAKNPTGPSPVENARGSDERARRAQWRGGRSARNVSVTLNPSSRSYSWKRLRPWLSCTSLAVLRSLRNPTEREGEECSGTPRGGRGCQLRSRGPQVRRLPGAPLQLGGNQAVLEAAPEADRWAPEGLAALMQQKFRASAADRSAHAGSRARGARRSRR